MIVAVLALGGAVAAVCTTGVTLGARIAPSSAGDATPSTGGPDGPGDGTAVPDRPAEADPLAETPAPSEASDDGTGAAPGAGTSEAATSTLAG